MHAAPFYDVSKRGEWPDKHKFRLLSLVTTMMGISLLCEILQRDWFVFGIFCGIFNRPICNDDEDNDNIDRLFRYSLHFIWFDVGAFIVDSCAIPCVYLPCLAFTSVVSPKTRVKIYLNIIFCLFDMYSFCMTSFPHWIECSNENKCARFPFYGFSHTQEVPLKVYKHKHTHSLIHISECVFAFHFGRKRVFAYTKYWIIQPKKFNTTHRKFILTTQSWKSSSVRIQIPSSVRFTTVNDSFRFISDAAHTRYAQETRKCCNNEISQSQNFLLICE